MSDLPPSDQPPSDQVNGDTTATNNTDRLRIFHALFDKPECSHTTLATIFQWVAKTKQMIGDPKYWNLFHKILRLPNFQNITSLNQILVQTNKAFFQKLELLIELDNLDHDLLVEVGRVCEIVIPRVNRKAHFENVFFKCVANILTTAMDKNSFPNHATVTFLNTLTLSVLETVISTQRIAALLSNTLDFLLVPVLCFRSKLIDELQKHKRGNKGEQTEKGKDVEDLVEVDEEALSSIKTHNEEQNKTIYLQDQDNFSHSNFHFPTNTRTLRDLANSFAQSRISISNGIQHTKKISYTEAIVSFLKNLEYVLLFGLFRTPKALAIFGFDLSKDKTEVKNNSRTLFGGLQKHLQNPYTSAIVGQGLGFIVSAFSNAAISINNTRIQQPSSQMKRPGSFETKSLPQRLFMNLYYLVSTTQVSEKPDEDEDDPNDPYDQKESKTDGANGVDDKKRKRDTNGSADRFKMKKPRGKKGGEWYEQEEEEKEEEKEKVAKDESVEEMLVRLRDKMRALANLIRAAGNLGTWEVTEKWIKRNLVPLAAVAHNMQVSSQNSSLTPAEFNALDASYDVFLGLQIMDPKLIEEYLGSLFKLLTMGVSVPCGDLLLGEIIDYCAVARQLDTLFTHLFTALRDETEFSSLYLAPKAVQKLCSHVSCLNAQIPPIWNMFLDEWNLKQYQSSKNKNLVVQRRARFLFLFGTFIRSVQFLTAVGFTMDSLYDAFDRSLVIAEQALKDFVADDTMESEHLFRSIVMLHSALIVISRRINPFREGKSDEVMKRNEKTFSNAFEKILKLVEKVKKKQAKSKSTHSKLNLVLCELMVYRIRDVAPVTYDAFVETENNSKQVLEIRTLVTYLLDSRPKIKERKCSCNSTAYILSPLETSLFSFTGISERDYPTAHWELMINNIGWIYSYMTTSELKSILSILFSTCSCFNASSFITTTIGTTSAKALSSAHFYEILPIRALSGDILLKSINEFTIDDESLPKSHLKIVKKLKKFLKPSSGEAVDDSVFKDVLSLLAKDPEPIALPNCKEISEKLTYQISLIQLLPHRWLGSAVGSRLAHAALACEGLASLLLRYTSKDGANEASNYLGPLFTSTRGLLLRMCASIPNVSLSLTKNMGKWIMDSPSFFKYPYMVALTQEMLGVYWVSAIKTNFLSVPLLEVCVDKNQKQLKSQGDVVSERIAVVLQPMLTYSKSIKTSDRKKKTTLVPLPMPICTCIINMQEQLHKIILKTTPKDPHFVSLITATGHMINVLVATKTLFKVQQDKSEISIFQPDFLKDLPALVKTVGQSMLPDLSQKDHLCSPKIVAASRLLIQFTKLSLLLEENGIPSYFGTLLLSLSQCLTNKATVCGAKDAVILRQLSRKMFKVVLYNAKATELESLQQNILHSLQYAISNDEVVYALQGAQLYANNRKLKTVSFLPSVAKLVMEALLAPLRERNSKPLEQITAQTDNNGNNGNNVGNKKTEGAGRASSADVLAKGLEVTKDVCPRSMRTVNVYQVLTLIPAATAMTGVTFVRCVQLLNRLLDADFISALSEALQPFVQALRGLLNSLSLYPQWIEESPNVRRGPDLLLILLSKTIQVYRRKLEKEVPAIVLDYIRLCENKDHGASLNSSLPAIRSGIVKLLHLCDQGTMILLHPVAVKAGNYTWKRIYEEYESQTKSFI